jgi:hypothetical protein
MAALNALERKRGFQAMQDQITAAGRVRRLLKAGNRGRLPSKASMLEAVMRLVHEADRGRNAMQAENLDPNDLHLGLIYSTTPKDESDAGSVGCKWLTAPAEIGNYIAALEVVEQAMGLRPLGILWAQVDREADAQGKPGGVMWAKPIVSGPDVERMMKASQGLFIAPKRIN